MNGLMKFAQFVAGAIGIAAAGPMAASAQEAQADAAICSADIRVSAPELLWDGTPPGMDEWGGILDIPLEESSTPDGNNLFNVQDPTIEAYLPDPDCATGASVLVVPGGGFRLVAINHEGRDVGRFLAERGIAAFVLKYRTVQYAEPSLRQPNRRDIAMDVMAEAAMADAHRAMALIKSREALYGIDQDRLGAVGFSAGGHVVTMLWKDAEAENRPAFTGVIYGALFTEEMPEFPAANMPLGPDEPEEPWLRGPPTPSPDRLPPLFLAIAQDDVAVMRGFRSFYDAVYAAGYRPETHLYATGGHGFGMNPQGLSTDKWPEQFYDWIAQNDMLVEGGTSDGE